MKFSELWLKEFIKFNINTKTLVNQLTINAGLEVEDIKSISSHFNNVVIGKIINYFFDKKDNIYILYIDIGINKLIKVFFKKFLKKNLYVVIAKINAILPSGKKVKPIYKKNYISEGILCSFFDFNIYEYSKNIIILPDNSPIGQSFYKYFKFKDNIININTPYNRGDILSLIGIAREISTINNCSLINLKKKTIKKKTNDLINIKIENLKICPYCIVRIIKKVNLKSSIPLYIKEKLRRCNLYTNNLITNITNYILIELGQPIQIFNKKINNNKLIIRMAKDNEIFIKNNKKIFLTSNTLVISDNKKILSIAGIYNNTKLNKSKNLENIVLISSFFNKKFLLKNSYQNSIENDYILDKHIKGIDYKLQKYAIEKITYLFIKICGGLPGPISKVINKKFFKKNNSIKLYKDYLYKILGYFIPDKKIKKILYNLGYNIKKTYFGWNIKVPSWRFDIKIQEDLIEDIFRIYKYKNISTFNIKKQLKLEFNKKFNNNILNIKNLLVNRGYQEIITYSFVNPKIQKLLHPNILPQSILDPISIEMSVMRVSLWTGLINVLIYNNNRQQKNIRLFENGLRFIPNFKKKLKIKEDLMLSGIISGNRFYEHWDLDKNLIDFYDIKGDVEDIFKYIGILEKIKFKKTNNPALHKKQSAKIILNNKIIGYVGMINPLLEKKLNLNHNIFVFEILCNKYFNNKIKKINSISNFPCNRRDISIIVKENILISDIIDECKKINKNNLIEINLFDVYKGKEIKNGFKSFSISFILQSLTHTLKENEINLIINKYIYVLKKKFQAFLRD